MDIAFWELLLDITGLILCAAAVVYLVRWRAAAREMAMVHALTGQEREFFESVLRQYLGSPKPEWTETEPPPGGVTETGRITPPLRFRAPVSDVPASGPGISRGEPVENPYDALRRLASEGFDAAEITRRLSLPRREVELALKLRQKVDGYYREHPGEMGALL